MIIGSPPVIRTLVTSGCCRRYSMTRSTLEVAIFRSGSSTNCAQRKQYVQYAWQVWPCLGKIRTVSGYLC